ncbi:MAG: PhoH family protein, partial [Selenomonadaceae bacterium]|nr:PhoH family protein [Selenomonadaceae bacterium]
MHPIPIAETVKPLKCLVFMFNTSAPILSAVVTSSQQKTLTRAANCFTLLKKFFKEATRINEQKNFGETIIVTANGNHIKAKSAGQQNYIDTMRRHVVTFGVGAAGTGKTFLAVAMAAYYLRVKEVRKIILTRPAVEAGERLGFLPGDMQEKVDPYLRPL